MSQDTLKGVKIAILATDGFEQLELLEPRERLHAAGATTTVIAPGDKPQIKAWNIDQWGDEVSVDLPLADAHASDYDALFLPGGVMNPDALRLVDEAVAFVRDFNATGRQLAAICHGPWTLINAGVVKGKRMTSWPSLRVDLENAGAQWEDREVVECENLITSRNPNDIPAFSDALINALSSRKQKAA